jgi:ribosomal protein S18 acetylase RimI-like enzyme
MKYVIPPRPIFPAGSAAAPRALSSAVLQLRGKALPILPDKSQFPPRPALLPKPCPISPASVPAPAVQRLASVSVSTPIRAADGRYRIEASANGQALGSLMVDLRNRGAVEVTNLKVDPAARGQGIGKVLLGSAARTALQHGRGRVTLASQDNGSGRLTGWYKGMGFRQVGVNRLGFPELEAPTSSVLSSSAQAKMSGTAAVAKPSTMGAAAGLPAVQASADPRKPIPPTLPSGRRIASPPIPNSTPPHPEASTAGQTSRVVQRMDYNQWERDVFSKYYAKETNTQKFKAELRKRDRFARRTRAPGELGIDLEVTTSEITYRSSKVGKLGWLGYAVCPLEPGVAYDFRNTGSPLEHYQTANVFHIYSFYSKYENQYKGIGKALLLQAVEIAVEQMCPFIVVVNSINDDAYKALGFTKAGRSDTFWIATSALKNRLSSAGKLPYHEV